MLRRLAAAALAAAALAASAQPAVIYELGGKFDRSFNQAAWEGAERWKQQTGRDYIQEIFGLQDRNGREFVLPMTHEETFTFHAKELQSYRQLPQSWYHFQTKNRDEPRPRPLR